MHHFTQFWQTGLQTVAGKIEFVDMAELIGVENARKIRAIVEGAKRSVEYGFHAGISL